MPHDFSFVLTYLGVGITELSETFLDCIKEYRDVATHTNPHKENLIFGTFVKRKEKSYNV